MTSAIAPTLADPAAAGLPQVRAGYGVSLTDVAAFENAIARAQATPGSAGVTVNALQDVQAPNAAMHALFRPLEQINGQAESLSALARSAVDAGRDMTPSEMVRITVKCHEFMFQCQLTSNAANRTSDGLQQLFRQQA